VTTTGPLADQLQRGLQVLALEDARVSIAASAIWPRVSSETTPMRRPCFGDMGGAQLQRFCRLNSSGSTATT